MVNGFAGEYRDELEVCPFCGTTLVWGPAPTVPDREYDSGVVARGVVLEGETARVGHYLEASQAELARGFLESQGIPARIERDTAGGVRPEIGVVTGIRLVVPASMAREAEALLAAVERRDHSPEE